MSFARAPKRETSLVSQLQYLIFLASLALSSCADKNALEQVASQQDGLPLSPVIFFPSVSPYTHVGAADSLVIEGNVSFTTQKLIGPRGVEIVPNGLVWRFTYTMTPDTETELEFVAVDREGRRSDPKKIIVRWFPTVSLPLALATPGGKSLDLNSSFSADVSSGPSGARVVDPLTLFRVDFGIHRVVREMRVAP